MLEHKYIVRWFRCRYMFPLHCWLFYMCHANTAVTIVCVDGSMDSCMCVRALQTFHLRVFVIKGECVLWLPNRRFLCYLNDTDECLHVSFNDWLLVRDNKRGTIFVPSKIEHYISNLTANPFSMAFSYSRIHSSFLRILFSFVVTISSLFLLVLQSVRNLDRTRNNLFSRTFYTAVRWFRKRIRLPVSSNNKTFGGSC